MRSLDWFLSIWIRAAKVPSNGKRAERTEQDSGRYALAHGVSFASGGTGERCNE
jgi:hypothetical protein